jgi:hypothetical protein
MFVITVDWQNLFGVIPLTELIIMMDSLSINIESLMS